MESSTWSVLSSVAANICFPAIRAANLSWVRKARRCSLAGSFVRNVFEEEEEVEKEEEDSNALSWVLCAAANKDEGQEGGTKEKRKNVHKINSRGRSTMFVLNKYVSSKSTTEDRSLDAPGILELL
jgi:hypothetical protein